MIYRKQAHILLICLMAGLFVSQVSAQRPTTTDTTKMSEAQKRRFHQTLESRALDYFTNGLWASEQGNYFKAARAFKAALDFFPESNEIAYSLAEAYTNLREPEMALQIAQRVDPLNVEILTVAARAYRLLGDADGYRAAYVKMAEIDPDNDRAYATLSEMYLRAGALDSAQWALDNLTRVRPADWQVYNQLGRVRLSLKQFTESLKAFDHSLELDRTVDNLNGWLGKADVYEALEQPDSSSVMLKAALDLAGPNPMLLSRMATALTDQNKFAEATNYVRELVKQVPNDLDQQRRLGMMYYYADSLEQAETIFDALIIRRDVNDLNHYFKALIFSARDEDERAKDQFAIVADLTGSGAEAWINLGMAYRTLGEADSALTTYSRGLRRVSTAQDSVNLIYATGAIQEEKGLIDESITSFEWVLSISPDFHPAMNYLGYMLADRNIRLEYALELISRAVEMQPNNTAYLDSYGWVYYRLGDYENALIYLKRAAELDSDPVMFDHLGDAFAATGDGQEAKLWWQRALDLDPDNEAIKEKLNE